MEVILHVEENDSKYRDIAPLIFNLFLSPGKVHKKKCHFFEVERV